MKIKALLLSLMIALSINSFGCEKDRHLLNRTFPETTQLPLVTKQVKEAQVIIEKSSSVIEKEAKDIRQTTKEKDTAKHADNIITETEQLRSANEKLKIAEDSLATEIITNSKQDKTIIELLDDKEKLKEENKKLKNDLHSAKAESEKWTMALLGILIVASIISLGISIYGGSLKGGIASMVVGAVSITVIETWSEIAWFGWSMGAVIGLILLYQVVMQIKSNRDSAKALEEQVITARKVKKTNPEISPLMRQAAETTQSPKTKRIIQSIKDKLDLQALQDTNKDEKV